MQRPESGRSGLERPEGGVELDSKVASGSARATLRRGWGNLELRRGGFGSGGCRGFSSHPTGEIAAAVKPDPARLPCRTYCHNRCSTERPCKLATSGVRFRAREDRHVT